jgi:hypothetical protein
MTDAYVPLSGPPTWHHAACRGEDPELWFPISMDKLDLNSDGETAVDICRRCPHTAECVTFAAETNTPDGIWGGLTPKQRIPVRPRKRTYSEAERWRRQRRLDDVITGWT